jgi:uncharacterized membrane protein YcaP (DUF421 family)
MDFQELGITAARAVVVYLFMLVVIRLLGKREVGNFSAFDLLVALMLGEIVDEVIYGDVNMAQGGTAILVIALAQYVTGWLSCLDHGMEYLLEGKPTVLVRNGELDRKGMRHERMSPHDVMAQLRMQGVDDMREVKLAVVEVNGQVSVLKQDWAEPVRKGDLPGPEAEQKRKDTGGREDPPPDKQTDSPKSLSVEA